VFDISFAELIMIAVIALLVIGPDKLPKVARTLGVYSGRLQRYIAQIKEEVNREVRFEELQNLQQEIKQGVDKTASSIMAGISDVQDAAVSAEAKAKPKRKPAATKSTTKTPAAKNPRVKKPVIKKAAVKRVKSKGS